MKNNNKHKNNISDTTKGAKTKAKALGLCSGGLDSMLAGMVLKKQGIDVVWVSFVTPFFSAKKAKKASKIAGIPLIVKDITERYLPMLTDPPAGYGSHMNPCMDCHSLMFRIAGEMMAEVGADFLFSGEVLGQRPMSQVKNSLRYVEKRSGYDGYILRPLSAKKLPVTWMEEQGLVDRDQLLAFSGRSRKPQIALAKEFGITEYPAPAGGCLLTDPNFSKRLKDLFDHQANYSRQELELLSYGRHLRLDDAAKLIVGRNKKENEKIEKLVREDADTRIRMHRIAGPFGVIPNGGGPEMVERAAAVCAGYSKAKKNEPAEVEVTAPGGDMKVVSVVPVVPEEVSDFLIP